MHARHKRSQQGYQKGTRAQQHSAHGTCIGAQQASQSATVRATTQGQGDVAPQNDLLDGEWEFPYLDVDSSPTLMKRAIVWNVLCAVNEIFQSVCSVTCALLSY